MALTDYRTALVTGASSGIGAAIVEALVAQGQEQEQEQELEVHALARRTERLEQLAKRCACTTHQLDINNSDALYQLGQSRDWDILVNNAGVLRSFSGLHNASRDEIDISIDTNIRATYHLLNAVLPRMIERQRGHIVIIGSMAGLYALQSSVYGGSKAAVHMLARNLRLELQGSAVRVTEICPGRVETEIYDRGIDNPELLDKLKDTKIKELEANDIAAAVLYALDTPWHVNVNMIEIQPTEQTYGGSQFVPRR